MVKHPKIRGKDWWRLLRVGCWLLRRPQDIVPYLRLGIQRGRTPLQLGMPWWSFGSVEDVGKRLHSGMEVFEFGSGGSTIFLAKRTARVTSVEDSSEWLGLVQNELVAEGLRNVELLERPCNFSFKGGFLESGYLNALGGRAYDLIVVDGQEGGDGVRRACFHRAEKFIKPGGLIVLDDSWRYSDLKFDNRARSHREFKGVGCCRRGVTSTCVFYY